MTKRSGANPEADDPDRLPGKKIEGAHLLERYVECVKRDDPVMDESRNPNCASSHTNPLRKRMRFQPKRTAAESAKGVKKRKVTYIGKMSSSGGQ